MTKSGLKVNISKTELCVYLSLHGHQQRNHDSGKHKSGIESSLELSGHYHGIHEVLSNEVLSNEVLSNEVLSNELLSKTLLSNVVYTTFYRNVFTNFDNKSQNTPS